MKVTDILLKSSRPFATFELVPPLKGSDKNKLYAALEPLMEFNPPFLNVTRHRDEVVYRETPDGNYKRVIITKRPGSVAIAAAIMKRFKVEVVPHVICGGATRGEIENTLLDLNFLDIQNVMALRGDPIPGEKNFTPAAGGYSHSIDLVRQVENMNRGIYLDDTLKEAVPTNFCVGVAGYPEKHYEAPNQEVDIARLKEKVDAGAEYIVTQLFFDNRKYFDFVKRAREAGIAVPIIPGIKPISTKRHIELLPKSFSIDIPNDLMKELLKCKDNDAIYRVGLEWCAMQCRELLAKGAKAIHFYTMSKSDNIIEIIKRSF